MSASFHTRSHLGRILASNRILMGVVVGPIQGQVGSSRLPQSLEMSYNIGHVVGQIWTILGFGERSQEDLDLDLVLNLYLNL